MKAKVLVLLAALLVVAVPALSQCPHNVGVFSTYAGTLLGGRVSEAWCGIDGTPGPGEPGNTEDTMSWDGASLGTQWRVWGMAIDAAGAVLVGSSVDAFGNGWMDYSTNYTGGQFWLAGSGPWGDGVTHLTGPLTGYNVSTRITLVGGQQVGATSNVYFTGSFSNCPAGNNCVIQYTIANAIRVWMTGGGTMPANYPGFLCGAGSGELFDACCIQTSIQCAVPEDASSWGTIKSLYR
jgi:hypothetical protein